MKRKIIIDSIHNAVIENDGIVNYIKCHCFGIPVCNSGLYRSKEAKALYKKCRRWIITAEREGK